MCETRWSPGCFAISSRVPATNSCTFSKAVKSPPLKSTFPALWTKPCSDICVSLTSSMHDQHANPKTDIQIAQETQIRPIVDIARAKLGIDPKDLLLYGHYKAKISLDYVRSLNSRPNG